MKIQTFKISVDLLQMIGIIVDEKDRVVTIEIEIDIKEMTNITSSITIEIVIMRYTNNKTEEPIDDF